MEWLAAHGLQPRWLRPTQRRWARGTGPDGDDRGELRELAALVSTRRGVCPLAAAVVDAVSSAADCAAVVLTTSCDQMRYVASLLEHQHGVPTFVMNVPSTWQTDAARSLYLAELQRVSRFLVARGGSPSPPAELARVMLQFDGARAELRQARGRLPAKAFAAALIQVREGLEGSGGRTGAGTREESDSGCQVPSGGRDPREEFPSGGRDLREVPLALAGGPLPEPDYELFDWVEQAGGRIVLDATEWGERTLPRPFDVERTAREPLGELADAYFGAIPDVFRRPQGALYEYLGRELSGRCVRGLIVRRYLWCDLWHAELLEAADALGVDESFCPVRAMLGAFVRQTHFPLPDLLTCSVGATCDDVSAIPQRLADMGHEILWWEVPHRRRPEPGEETVALPGGFHAPACQVGVWRYAESVLILDDMVIVTPGGKRAIVSLDKTTGQTRWQANVSATAGYSSCIAVREGDGTIIANGSQSGLLLVDAKTGAGRGMYDFAAGNVANVPTPAYADGHLLWAVGYGKGGLCLRVSYADGRWSVAEAWTTKDLSCDPGNYVIAGGAIFAAGKGGLTCIDLKTGRLRWNDHRIRAGSICWADGLLYVFAESRGVLRLVEPLSGGCRIKGTVQVAGLGKSWALPVVIGGRLYLRYDTNLYCYDVAAK